MCLFFLLTTRLPPRATRTDTLFPSTPLFRSLVHTGNDVVEEITLRIGIGHVLDCLAETMFVKFMQQDRARRALHILLIKRLNRGKARSEEHTSELQSLMRISYAVFCLNNIPLITQNHPRPIYSHSYTSF